MQRDALRLCERGGFVHSLPRRGGAETGVHRDASVHLRQDEHAARKSAAGKESLGYGCRPVDFVVVVAVAIVCVSFA